jgi:hypothetical protein
MGDEVIGDGECDKSKQVHPPSLITPKRNVATMFRDHVSVDREIDWKAKHTQEEHRKSGTPNWQRNGSKRKDW